MQRNAPTEWRPEEMQRAGPSREPLSRQEDASTDDELVDKQPSVNKAFRTQAKTQTTELINKITTDIESGSSRSFIKELRSQLVEHPQECTDINDQLAWARGQSAAALEDHLRWIAELEASSLPFVVRTVSIFPSYKNPSFIRRTYAETRLAN